MGHKAKIPAKTFPIKKRICLFMGKGSFIYKIKGGIGSRNKGPLGRG